MMQAHELQEILVPAHGDAVFGDAAEAGHDAVVEPLVELAHVADGLERHARAAQSYAGNLGRQRLDLEPVDGDDGVPVIHQVMREREARGAEPDDQHLLSRWLLRQRAAQVERVPARQQRIDLEAPGQRQHVLQGARLDLRDVDRLLLLIDAGLHAVVADAVAGRGHHRVVDRDDGERADAVAPRLHQVHLGDFLFERAAGERHAERALLERAGLAVFEAARAAVLALVVAPDAVIRLVERAGEIGAGIGQREAVAQAPLLLGQAQHGDAVLDHRLDRHEMIGIDLVRHLEEHARLVPFLALGRERRPGGVARGEIERCGICFFIAEPAIDRGGKTLLGQRRADQIFERTAQLVAVDRRRLRGRNALHRAALHEEALHRIERRKRVVPRLQRADFRPDAEEVGQKILEMRRQIDQQVGLVLGRERCGIAPRRDEAVMQRHIARREMGDEGRVERHEPVAGIKPREGEAVFQGEIEVAHRRLST